jgi:hypothetical protein
MICRRLDRVKRDGCCKEHEIIQMAQTSPTSDHQHYACKHETRVVSKYRRSIRQSCASLQPLARGDADIPGLLLRLAPQRPYSTVLHTNATQCMHLRVQSRSTLALCKDEPISTMSFDPSQAAARLPIPQCSFPCLSHFFVITPSGPHCHVSKLKTEVHQAAARYRKPHSQTNTKPCTPPFTQAHRTHTPCAKTPTSDSGATSTATHTSRCG